MRTTVIRGGDGIEDADFTPSVQDDGPDAAAPVGGNRRDQDRYYTPPWAISALLRVEKFPGLIWEPAQGDRRLVRALQAAGSDVIGTDLDDGVDFLATKKTVDHVVTNPPWDRKADWIRHAQECARHKIALLLPLACLSGVKLIPLFTDPAFPLSNLHVLCGQLAFIPTGNVTMAAGWFIGAARYKHY